MTTRNSKTKYLNTDEMNERIWNLWNENRHENSNLAGPRIPKFLCPLKKRVNVLFLGLNPSFPEKLDFRKDIETKGLNYPKDFNWEHSGLSREFDQERASLFASVHTLAQKQGYPFFKRLQILASDCGQDDYQVTDIFLRLEADSRCLPAEYGKPRNHHFNSKQNFIKTQLDICYDQITIIQPRIIVGVFAGASDIFLRYYKSRPPGNGSELRKTRFEKVCPKLSRIDLPTTWQNPVPFFRCSHLPYGNRLRQMNEDEFKKIREEIKRATSNTKQFIHCSKQ